MDIGIDSFNFHRQEVVRLSPRELTAHFTDALDMALAASGCDSAQVIQKPRLLRDNCPSYIAGELADYIEA